MPEALRDCMAWCSDPLGGLGSQKPVPTTQFAQVVGMAQTWDVDLIRKAGEVQAVEARWLYNHQDKYQRKPLIVWGPEYGPGARSALGPHR